MPRPKKPIDLEQLRQLGEYQMSTEQVAAFFRVSRDTIERHYAAILKEARQAGTAKLIIEAFQRAKVSDRIFEHLLNRYLGAIPKKIEITKEQAIEFLENEVKRDGAGQDSESTGEG